MGWFPDMEPKQKSKQRWQWQHRPAITDVDRRVSHGGISINTSLDIPKSILHLCF